jgi:anti-sigma factor RsiW
MIDGERTTSPVIGSVLVSFALGELDAEEQSALEKKLEQNPALREELEEIKRHLTLHEEVRKIAPRRGSFERLHARMKREGAFDGAVPGAHCMLRRSFTAAMVFGLVAVVLLAVFAGGRLTRKFTATPEAGGSPWYSISMRGVAGATCGSVTPI